jgi:hypothetical protein
MMTVEKYEANKQKERAAHLLAVSDGGVEFWQYGGAVYRRAGRDYAADADGCPMDLRWECSKSIWDQFRGTTYAWAKSPEGVLQ